MVFKNVEGMVKVFKLNIFHPEIINDEAELNGMPFVAPETWGGFCFVISFSKKVGSKEIVGKNAGLGKAIAALANFEVNSAITILTFKFVFLNEFRGYICD